MTDHSHDFDFEIGKWKVRHTQRAKRLANSHDWIAFDGTSHTQTTLGGHGNVEDNFIDKPDGAYRAKAIRAYDPRTEEWSIWWLDARTPKTIGAPVVGNFKNGEGVFEGDDTFDGKLIKVRFLWTTKRTDTAHWEQAFSPDNGKTWETNWRMDFTRIE